MSRVTLKLNPTRNSYDIMRLDGREAVVLAARVNPEWEPSVHVMVEPSKDLPEGFVMWVDSDEVAPC